MRWLFLLYTINRYIDYGENMEIRVSAGGVQEECKGRFFRFTEAGFSGQNGRVVQTKELRPLKSISCPGCAVCRGLDDELKKRANEKGFLQFCPSLKSGDTVTLLQVPVDRNWDTGELKEWYYEVKPANST